MKPIGLTFKHSAVNPFTGRSNGDLMVIHMCTNCGKISCNRISGDDNEYVILSVFDESIFLDEAMSSRLKRNGISILTKDDKDDVKVALFGRR